MKTEIAQLKISYDIVDSQLEELRHLAVELQHSDGSSYQQKQEWLAQYAQLLYQVEHEVFKEAQRNESKELGRGILENTKYITEISKSRNSNKYQADRAMYAEKLKNLLGNKDNDNDLLAGEDTDTWTLADLSKFFLQQQEQLTREIADTLYQFAKEAVGKIPKEEWRTLKFSGPKIRSCFKEVIQSSEKISNYVVEDILSKRDINARTLAFEFWINVASECINGNNLFAAMAINAAFNNSSIHRLRNTKAGLSEAAEKNLAHLNKTLDSTDAVYKQQLAMQEPFIPALGPLMTAMTFANDKLEGANARNEALLSQCVSDSISQERCMPNDWDNWANEQPESNRIFLLRAVTKGFTTVINEQMSSWENDNKLNFLRELISLTQDTASTSTTVAVPLPHIDNSTSRAQITSLITSYSQDIGKAGQVATGLTRLLDSLSTAEPAVLQTVTTEIAKQAVDLIESVASADQTKQVEGLRKYSQLLQKLYVAHPLLQTSSTVQQELQNFKNGAPTFDWQYKPPTANQALSELLEKVVDIQEGVGQMPDKQAQSTFKQMFENQRTVYNNQEGNGLFEKNTYSTEAKTLRGVVGQNNVSLIDVYYFESQACEVKAPSEQPVQASKIMSIKAWHEKFPSSTEKPSTTETASASVAVAVPAPEAEALLDQPNTKIEQPAQPETKHYAVKRQETGKKLPEVAEKIIEPSVEVTPEPKNRKILWTASMRSLDPEILQKIGGFQFAEDGTILLKVLRNGNVISSSAEKADIKLKVNLKQESGKPIVQSYEFSGYTDNAVAFIPYFKSKIIDGTITTDMPTDYAKQKLGVTAEQLAAGNAKYAAPEQEIQSRVVKTPVSTTNENDQVVVAKPKEDIAEEKAITVEPGEPEKVVSQTSEPKDRAVLWTCYGRELDSEIVKNIEHLIDAKEYQSDEERKQTLALKVTNKGRAIIKADADSADMALEVTFKKFQDSVVVQGYKLTAYNKKANHFIPNFKDKIIEGEIETRIPAEYAQRELGITPKQLLQGNKKYLAKSPIKEQFERDVRELQAAVDTKKLDDAISKANDETTKQELELEKKRAETTGRMLLAPILSGLNIRSNKHDTWHPASDSTIPAAAFFSHGGRIMETLDSTEDAIDYLGWLFQVDQTKLTSAKDTLKNEEIDSFKRAELAINQLLKEISSLKPDNPEAAKKDGKLLYVRQASTHTTKQTKFDAVQTATDGSVKTIKEVKSKAEGLRSFVTNVLNRVRGKQELTGHLGMTLAIGGLDNIAPDGSKIKADERSGHLFFHVKVHKDGTVSIMKGLEPSGPGSHKNVFGEGHSNLGNPGKFSPTGGLKFLKGKEPKKDKLTVWDGFEEKYGTKPPAKHDCMAVHLSKEVVTKLKEVPKELNTTALLAKPVQPASQLLGQALPEQTLRQPASFTFDEWQDFSKFVGKTPLDTKLVEALTAYTTIRTESDNETLSSQLDRWDKEKAGIITKDDASSLMNLYAADYPELMETLTTALQQTHRWLLLNPKHQAADKVKVLHMRLLIDQVNITNNYYQLFYQQLNLSDQASLLTNWENELTTYQQNLAQGQFILTPEQVDTVAKLINQRLQQNRETLNAIRLKLGEKQDNDLAGQLLRQGKYNKSYVDDILSYLINNAINKNLLIKFPLNLKERISGYQDKFEQCKKDLANNLASLTQEESASKRHNLLKQRIELLQELDIQFRQFLQEKGLAQYQFTFGKASGKTILDLCELRIPKAILNYKKGDPEPSKHSEKLNLSEAIREEIEAAKKQLKLVEKNAADMAKPMHEARLLAENLAYVIETQAAENKNVAIVQRLITALGTCGLVGKTKDSHAPLISYLNGWPIEINLEKKERVKAFVDYLAGSNYPPNNKSTEVKIDSLPAETSKDSQKTSLKQKLVAKEPKFSLRGLLLSFVPEILQPAVQRIQRWWQSYQNPADSKTEPAAQSVLEVPTTRDIRPILLQFPYDKAGNTAKLQLDIQEERIWVTFQFPPKDQPALAVTEGKEVRIDAKELEGLASSALGYKYSDQMLAEQPKNCRSTDHLGDNRYIMHHDKPKAVQSSETPSPPSASYIAQPEDNIPRVPRGLGNGTISD